MAIKDLFLHMINPYNWVFHDKAFLSDYLTDLKLHRKTLILSKFAQTGVRTHNPRSSL